MKKRFILLTFAAVIAVLLSFALCACFCQDKQTDNKGSEKMEIKSELKESAEQLSKNIVNEFMALENAVYPCSYNSAGPYKQSVMKFIQDMGLRSKVVFTEDKTTGSYYYDVAATQGLENVSPIILYSDIDTCKGTDEGLQDGVTINEEKGEIVGNGNYSMAAKSCMGISTALSVIKDKSIKHGKLRVVFSNSLQQVINTALFNGYDYVINLSGSDKVAKIGVSSADSCKDFNDSIDKDYKEACGLDTEKFSIDLNTSKKYVYIGPNIENEGSANEKVYTKSITAHAASILEILSRI